MGRSTEDAQIIKDLEHRLSDAEATIAWHRNRIEMKEEQEVERLIELMDTHTFSRWFNQVMVRENESLGTAIADIVEDQIDYSDVFRERVNDIISTETYELTHDIKQGIIDEVEDVLPVMVRNVLKGLKVKVTYDEIN